RFGERLSGIPMEHVRALATNTLRRSRNPRAFLLLAETALGHPVEVISGHEEARLIYVGVSHDIAADNRRLVVDIGGGSTELIVGSGEWPEIIETLSAGCVTVSERFFADGKITRSALRAAQTAVALELRPIRSIYRNAGWNEAIGSSGTVRAVAQVMQESGWAIRRVTRSGLKKLRRALESAGKVSRLDLPGLSEERRPVFPGGVAVLSACFRNLEIEEMRVSEYALREGALYDLIGRVRHSDPRTNSVVALATRYQIDQAQAMRVHDTALAGFDQIRSAWDLTEHDRESLRWAARLHEIGLAIAHTDYHRHGAYLARHATLNGFSRREQLVLSALILGHRRKLSAQIVAELPEDLTESVMLTCVVLRLAVLLHRSRQIDELPEIQWRAHDSCLVLTFPHGWLGTHPLTGEDLSREREYLKRVGIELTVE
ncbi:MAG: hypothetical protein AMS18_11235, partial [Gemmatimonas sp. SG8_17]